MRVLARTWIALCLVVGTRSRTLTGADEETDTGGPLKKAEGVYDSSDICREDQDCANGAECNDDRGTRTCKCLIGTSGIHCEIIDDCKGKLWKCIGDKGACVYNIKAEKAECKCEENMIFKNDGGHCEEICKEDQDCLNGAKCNDERGAKTCRCLRGTSGTHCEIVDDCMSKLWKCRGDKGTCVYNSITEEAECKCDENMIFKKGEGHCDVNPCDSKPCQNGGTCQLNGSGSYMCNCAERYAGRRCEDRICSLEEQEDCGDAICEVQPSGQVECVCAEGEVFNLETKSCEDFCIPNPCKNGGLCVKSTKKCTCPSIYYGAFCEKCACENGFCNTNSTGKSFCTCPPEWGLSSSTECKECDCGKGSNCTFEEKSVWSIWGQRKDCLCKVGYEDINGFCRGTCRKNPCLNAGRCLVKGNDIECKCNTPFFGELCEKDVCDPNPCKNGGRCTATNGEANCKCIDPYKGTNCTENECEPNPCKNGGRCTAANGKAICKCIDPYIGRNCTENVCEPNPCKNGGRCTATNGEAICKCIAPYIGRNCTENVCEPNPCKNGGRCTAVNGKAICECIDPYVGTNCTEKIVFPANTTSFTTESSTTASSTTTLPTTTPSDATSDTTVNATELSTGSGTIFPISTIENSTTSHLLNFSDTANSQSGYTGETTTETDTCAENPCQNGGTCLVVGNTSKCLCKKPYLGILCETDPCDWYPCKNGGICKIENETLACFCKEPFTGEFCESRIRMDVYVITLIAVSVFLTVVLIFVICALCQRYPARKKN